MPPYSILHFSTILRGPAFLRLTRRIEAHGVQIVFDLEDTYWDPDDPLQTARGKAEARRMLLELATERTAAGMGPLTVRVNGLESAELPHDLAALEGLATRTALRCVVLPKVERAEAVAGFLGQCARVDAAVPEVIPLIETERGVASLRSLLAELRRMRGEPRVQRVMYGAFDHCLDMGRWPFWDPESDEFWEFLRGFVALVESQGFEYVHTPVDAIADHDLFRRVIARLGTVCRRPYHVSTLVETQTLVALEPPASAAPTPGLPRPGLTEAEARARARRVLSAYGKRKRLGRGFVIDARLGRFISPHEIVAARAYLEAHADDNA